MFDGAHPAVIVTTFFSGVLFLALVAVVLSEKAQTVGVLGQVGTTVTDIIKAAVSPVTGGGDSLTLYSGNK